MRQATSRHLTFRQLLLAALAVILVACGGGSDQSSVVKDPPLPGVTRKVTFKPTTMRLPHPERGEAGWIGDLTQLNVAELEAELNSGYPLLRTHIELGPWAKVDLPDDFLDRLQAGFDSVRRHGAKLVPRFIYANPPADFDTTIPVDDAPIEQVLRHIAQLKPYLRRNGDVIAYMEAGFAGAWGEWHSSANALDSPINKALLRDAILDAVPQERHVLFRYPADLRRWQNEGGDLSRMGVHNDCFLSGEDDAGTYPDEEESLRSYTMELVRDAPFGAETCQAPPPRSSCADILAEGKAYSLVYLNRFGNRSEFQEIWDREGCLDEVKNSLGFRIVLESLEAPESVDRGVPFPLTVTVRNAGWSRIFNPHSLAIRFTPRSGGAGEELIASGVDPTSWQPTPGSTPPLTVTTLVTLPVSLAPGEYALALGLPDSADTLFSDARFAIRFANADDPSNGQAWDADAGRFLTGLHLLVR